MIIYIILLLLIITILLIIVIMVIGSHGLNAGLGTSGQPSFPAKINTGPAQAARMANSTRFSPADWSASNIDHYNGADASRNNSERVYYLFKIYFYINYLFSTFILTIKTKFTRINKIIRFTRFVRSTRIIRIAQMQDSHSLLFLLALTQQLNFFHMLEHTHIPSYANAISFFLVEFNSLIGSIDQNS